MSSDGFDLSPPSRYDVNVHKSGVKMGCCPINGEGSDERSGEAAGQ